MKMVSNEGHFTLEAETVFYLHLLSHCSVVPEICHMGLHAHALQAMEVKLN
jgi:hypothetical protein